jgi:tetratricopeptide (TPR) repeat protein
MERRLGKTMGRSVTILVVGDEESFVKFIGHFSPSRYAVLYAKNLDHARKHLQSKQPRLVVLGTDQAEALAAMLKEAKAQGAALLGIARGKPSSAAELLDVIVEAGAADQLVAAANELLKERRRGPRVVVELPVQVEGIGAAEAKVASDHSLFIATDKPLERGKQVKLTIEGSDKPMVCSSRVARVGKGESGHHGMVLEITSAPDACKAYLQGLVHWVTLLEHYQQTAGTESPALPEPITQLLVRRALQALHDSDELPEAIKRRHTPAGVVVDGAVSGAEASKGHKELEQKLARQQAQIKSLKDQLEGLSQTKDWSPVSDGAGDNKKTDDGASSALVTTLQQQVEQLQQAMTDQASEVTQKLSSGTEVRGRLIQGLGQLEQRLSAIGEELSRLQTVGSDHHRQLLASASKVKPQQGEPTPEEIETEQDEGPTMPSSPQPLWGTPSVLRPALKEDSDRLDLGAAKRGEDERNDDEIPTAASEPESLPGISELVNIDTGERLTPESLRQISAAETAVSGESAMPSGPPAPDGAPSAEFNSDSDEIGEAFSGKPQSDPLGKLPWAFPEDGSFISTFSGVSGDTNEPRPPPGAQPAGAERGGASGAQALASSEESQEGEYQDEDATTQLTDDALDDLANKSRDETPLTPEEAALAEALQASARATEQVATPGERGVATDEILVAAKAVAAADRSDQTEKGQVNKLGEVSSMPVGAPARLKALWIAVFIGVGLMAVLGIVLAIRHSRSSDRPPSTGVVVKPKKATPKVPSASPQDAAARSPAAASSTADAGVSVVTAPTVTGPADAGAVSTDTEPALAPSTKSRAMLRRERVAAQKKRLRFCLKRSKKLIRKQKHKEARKLLTVALKISDDYRVRSLMARSHQAAGELWPASHHLQKAASKAPKRLRPGLYNRLGLIYVKLGKRSKACAAFKQAQAARPGDRRASLHISKHCK